MITLQTSAAARPPHWVAAELLPHRGMNTFQLWADLPARGLTPVLASPGAQEAAERFAKDGPDDIDGNLSFSLGGAILVPFANRIRGELLPDGHSIATEIAGHRQTLPANWKGKRPGAEPHAMHGLILRSSVEEIEHQRHAGVAQVSARLRAGDFGGHWPSSTELRFEVSLSPACFRLQVTAKNVGNEPLPMGIGWHPYFRIPSGQRAQARLFIPAQARALVNNLDDVFPTGEVESVAGTDHDFAVAGGRPLEAQSLDDCFVRLVRDREGAATAEIHDPAGGYGLQVRARSPQIKAFQVYAPPQQSFIALEPQFNWADPYSKVWPKGTDTGMVSLATGQSVSYLVELTLIGK